VSARLFIRFDMPENCLEPLARLDPIATEIRYLLIPPSSQSFHGHPLFWPILRNLRLLLILVLAIGMVFWFHTADAFGATGGLVIYKQFSFDSDFQAEIANYSSGERLSLYHACFSEGRTFWSAFRVAVL